MAGEPDDKNKHQTPTNPARLVRFLSNELAAAEAKLAEINAGMTKAQTKLTTEVHIKAMDYKHVIPKEALDSVSKYQRERGEITSTISDLKQQISEIKQQIAESHKPPATLPLEEKNSSFRDTFKSMKERFQDAVSSRSDKTSAPASEKEDSFRPK